MKKPSKRRQEILKLVDTTKRYSLEQATDLIKKCAEVKHARKNFDETVELAVRLGVDPKHADQMVRGAIVLPHGTGMRVRVLVFAKGDKIKEAEAAGADVVGGEELVQRVTDGFLEFDRVIATPDMMGQVGKLGKILGPKGLMPNPKVGTVTFDVTSAIRDAKAGKIEYRTEKAGIIHARIGKASFDNDKIKENANTLIQALLRAKPAAAKGQYLRSITLSSTVGPGIKIDLQSFLEKSEEA